MAGNLPTVCIFGLKNINLQSVGPVANHETRELDCKCYLTDEDFDRILVEERPDVFVTFGAQNEFPNLLNASFDIRRRWVHFDSSKDIDDCGCRAFGCFIDSCLRKREDAPPFVSVFTPAYKTGERILRPYHSLKRQQYRDWEWVILDDSDDDYATFRMLEDLAAKDHHITVHKMHRHSGVIGEVKNIAASLCKGDILVELDHDDELTENALSDVVEGFKQFPEAGFVYTDCAEVYENGNLVKYGDGWGLGYGSYRQEA